MIEIRNIFRQWDGFTLGPLSFTVEPGRILGISGHNGAGKTLLLEMIAGIWFPQSGSVRIDGRDITVLPPEKRNIGFVYQEPFLFPHLPVRDNIAYGLRARREKKKVIDERLDKLRKRLGLGDIFERNNTALLSGGEKQRVSLARALAVHPALLLLDEPTHSLDVESRRLFYAVLDTVKETRLCGVVYVSHEYGELKGFCDRICVMEKGKCIRTDEIARDNQ
jgi:ABC-type sugar transport system ATPase subunit